MTYPTHKPHPDDVGFIVGPRSTSGTDSKSAPRPIMSAINNARPTPPMTYEDAAVTSTSKSTEIAAPGTPSRTHLSRKRTTRARGYTARDASEANSDSSASGSISSGNTSVFEPDGNEIEVKDEVVSDSDTDSDDSAKPPRKRRATGAKPNGTRGGAGRSATSGLSGRGRARARASAGPATPQRPSHPSTPGSGPGRNTPYTAEEDWVLFCCLFPMVTAPDLDPAMALTGRDKVVSSFCALDTSCSWRSHELTLPVVEEPLRHHKKAHPGGGSRDLGQLLTRTGADNHARRHASMS